MRNPAEVFTAQNFKASLLERRGVFLERGQVAFFFTLFRVTKFVLQGASKDRKTVVHVNYHTNSFRCEQAENIARAIQLFPGAMAIADRVYADNEVKGVLQFRRFLPQSGGKVSKQRFVFRHAKSNASFVHSGRDNFEFPCWRLQSEQAKSRCQLRSQP